MVLKSKTYREFSQVQLLEGVTASEFPLSKAAPEYLLLIAMAHQTGHQFLHACESYPDRARLLMHAFTSDQHRFWCDTSVLYGYFRRRTTDKEHIFGCQGHQSYH